MSARKAARKNPAKGSRHWGCLLCESKDNYVGWETARLATFLRHMRTKHALSAKEIRQARATDGIHMSMADAYVKRNVFTLKGQNIVLVESVVPRSLVEMGP